MRTTSKSTWTTAGTLALVCAAVVAAGTAAGGATALSQKSPLEGTWRTSFTEAEFVKLADVTEYHHPVNWGSFVLRMGNGRWSGTKVDAPAGRTDGGSYTVAGAILTLKGIWRYRWSVNGDLLRLQKVPPNSKEPTGYVVKPWRKVR